MSSVAEQPLHRALGLTDGELDRIRSLLGRDPNDFELGVFSLLWSEHCGYKHSALLLSRFPTEGPTVLQGPGENAGVVDLGEGLACAFKVESHNHPSAVEPFQGAATGVGGILRDIIAMGARPIALLDGLRFGAEDFSFERAVGGIGHYGNCVGVPTVGGEAVFDLAYRHNPLVNAMCVGILPAERVTRARASGAGNLVVLYGATTGRDGIGGASVLASQELSDEDEDKRPTVQIGDPFTGKKLIEASLELTEEGLVESLQDLGAAGLASSLAEMAARGGAGLDVHLDRVPLREPDLAPVEIMVSESQERMVAVVAPEGLAAVEAVCRKWELHSAVIGQVTETGELRAYFEGEEIGAIPVELLTEETPRYRVETAARALAEPLEQEPRQVGRDELLDADPIPERPQPPARFRALRPPRRLPDGAPARAGRGRPPSAPLAPWHRGLARRPRAGSLARPARRRGTLGLRGGTERRVRRRSAAGDHRLPQLRESRRSRDRVGARRGDRGHGARVRGARDPCRLRERLALQRDGRPRHPTDAGRRLRGRRRGRPHRPGRLARGRRRPARRRRPGRAGRLRVPERAFSAARPGGRRRPTTSRRPRSSTSSGARRPC